jgi:hypothetical protein
VIRLRTRILLGLVALLIASVAIGTAIARVYGGTAKVVPPLVVALGGEDTNPCTAKKPCATLQGAFERAKPGRVVEVAAGSYPKQELAGQVGALPRVVFKPAPGAKVEFAGLEINAKYVEVRDFNPAYLLFQGDSDHAIARDIDTGPLFIYGSTNLKVLGGDFGPSYTPGQHSPPSYINIGRRDGVDDVPPQNILIDGVLFHDFRRGTPEDHMECLHVPAGDGITIRNSSFVRCDIFDVFFTQWANPSPPKNVLLENNFFDLPTVDGEYKCCSYFSVRFSDSMLRYENIALRYNSSRSAFSVGTTPKLNVSMTANVAPNQQYGCDPNITYAYNVWAGAKCSRTDKNAKSGFVDPVKMNLHLKLRSAAVNAGSPKVFPAKDIDGQKRPAGKRSDAGADERR